MANMQLGNVKEKTRRIVEEVVSLYQEIGIVWGLNPNSKPEHSSGYAADFMVSDKALGDKVADYLWKHRSRFGVKWIIWRRRIRSTSKGKPTTWQNMSDRGNSTLNHMDHVHVFFNANTYKPLGTPKPDTTIDFSAMLRDINNDTASHDIGIIKGVMEKRGYYTRAKANATIGGRWDDQDKKAYGHYQHMLGYRGVDANGIPGRVTLTALFSADGGKYQVA